MNAYRRIMLRVMRGAGVSSRWYDHKEYPLCWNVKMDKAVTFDDVFACMVEHHYINEAEAILRIPSVAKLRHAWYNVENSMHEHVIEDMRGSFSSDDTMKFTTPERAKMWGIMDPKNGYDCKYQFVGRSGGWLALTEFAGNKIDSEIYCDPSLGYEMPRLVPNYWLPYLYAMCEEIGAIVVRRRKEMMYLLAFEMRYNMPEVVPK
jgi:hypothetical protein